MSGLLRLGTVFGVGFLSLIQIIVKEILEHMLKLLEKTNIVAFGTCSSRAMILEEGSTNEFPPVFSNLFIFLFYS